jgi:uncharacterized membrane protein YgaE (UPF0421/DUF939 family)
MDGREPVSGRTSSSPAEGSEGQPSTAERLAALRPAPWRHRIARLRRYAWHVAQCAVAAALAWSLARFAIGHPTPFFAPVAAIVSLGLGYGRRLRRVAEVTVGVALGVLIGDVFVHVFGAGPWQVLVVVVLAMSIAVLLDASPLLITQAGVQSAIIVTLAPTPQVGFGRWLDAVCGGAVALVVAAVVPRTPLRRPRLVASRVLQDLSGWLEEAAYAVRAPDLDRAYAVLDRARDSDQRIADVRSAAEDGLSVAASSPWRRGHREDMRAVVRLSVPLDRAVRNSRVLLRRVTVVVRRGEKLPDATLRLLDDLAAITATLATDVERRQPAGEVRAGLVDVARRSSAIPIGVSLSADVVLAQVRSLVVDLLQVTGLGDREALELVPATGPPSDAPD